VKDLTFEKLRETLKNLSSYMSLSSFRTENCEMHRETYRGKERQRRENRSGGWRSFIAKWGFFKPWKSRM